MDGDRGRRKRRIAAGLLVLLLLVWLLLRGGPAPGPRALPRPGPVPRDPPAAPAPAAAEDVDPLPHPAALPAPAAESLLDGDPDPAAVPLSVVVLDGRTGQPLPGCSLVLPAGEGRRYRLRPEGTRHHLAASPLRRGTEAVGGFEVSLPPGFLAADPGLLWWGGSVIAPGAAAVEVRLVAWPEARATVRVEEADGSPAAGADSGWRSGTRAGGGLPTDTRGEALLRGIPSIPGEPLRVHAGLGTRFTEGTLLLPAEPAEEARLTLVLPGPSPEEEESSLPAGAEAEAAPEAEDPGPPARPRPPVPAPGSLVVRVLRADGAPAPGLSVNAAGREAFTDPGGRALFPAVPAGRHHVLSGGLGILVERGEVEVRPGEEAILDLRETPLTDFEATVLDERGLLVPGVSLSLEFAQGGRHFVMEGGTQVIGLLTGPDGRCRLPGVPVHGAWLRAALGSRRAMVALEGGGAVEVRLPPAGGPAPAEEEGGEEGPR